MAHPLPTPQSHTAGSRAPFKCARSCTRPACGASWLPPVAPDHRAGTSATPPRITTSPALRSQRSCPQNPTANANNPMTFPLVITREQSDRGYLKLPHTRNKRLPRRSSRHFLQ